MPNIKRAVMSREMAIDILTEQKNRFLDEWVDFGNVVDAYDLALECMKAVAKPVKARIEISVSDNRGWHYVCWKCFGQIDIQDCFCRHCGRPIDHD